MSFSHYCNAQTPESQTPNLVTNPLFSGTNGWSVSGFTGGDPKGEFTFSYMAGIITQNINIATALSNALVQLPLEVVGLRYGWSYKIWCNNSVGGDCLNPKGPVDTLTGQVDVYDIRNNLVSRTTHVHNTYTGDNWNKIDEIVRFNKSYQDNELSRITFAFTGKDEGYWAGFYGPKITAVHARLLYRPNMCAMDPTFDVTCPGYGSAVFAKQCKENSLSSPECPGYQQAYLNQQCAANSLFNSACPGYQQALFALECSKSALYNLMCPGFEEARTQFICTTNVLYSPQCPGYQQALFEKNCRENPLSNAQCPTYQAAYLDAQCKLNPLFSSACPLYQSAFLAQQCNINVFYSPSCPGYSDAYKNKVAEDMCKSNPQASPTCPGYTGPKIEITNNSLGVPSVGNEDLAKLLTTPQLTNDPIVNQVLSAPGAGDGAGRTNEPVQTQRPTRQSESAKQKEQEKKVAEEKTKAQGSVRSTQQNARRGAEPSQQEMQVASMAEVPGFSSYAQANIPDVPFYKVEDIYRRALIPDNARALRQLNQRSDKIHKEMVDEQYRK